MVDVVSLQHLDLASSASALAEVARVLKPHGVFFSYRLSDNSDMWKADAERTDTATLANIPNGFPLANNGPTSFWNPVLARQVYAAAGLKLTSWERIGRTYAEGAFVEYLALTAELYP